MGRRGEYAAPLTLSSNCPISVFGSVRVQPAYFVGLAPSERRIRMCVTEALCPWIEIANLPLQGPLVLGSQA